MTIDISELIRNIRAYAAARDAYDNDRSEDNGLALEKATAMLTGEYYAGEEIREAFVELADHCERLQARIDAALAVEGWYPEQYEISDYTRGGNAMHDEFRAKLLGGEK